MMTKKSQEDTFNEKVAPTLERLINLCEKHGIAICYVAQVGHTTGAKLHVEALYKKQSSPVFDLMYRVSTGKLIVTDNGNNEFTLRDADAPAFTEEYEDMDALTLTDDELDALSNGDISNIPLILPFSGIVH